MEGAREGFPNERRMFLTKLIVITYQVLLVVKNPPANARNVRDPWVGKIPKNTLLILPEESHGQRSLADYSLCGCTELNMTEVT